LLDWRWEFSKDRKVFKLMTSQADKVGMAHSQFCQQPVARDIAGTDP
jgi:hypothetical protein